jgi:hypothetical protein
MDGARECPNSLFRTHDDGLLLIAVGHDRVNDVYRWHDAPLLFCPFCGEQAQERPDISARNARGDASQGFGSCCTFLGRAHREAEHAAFRQTGSEVLLTVGYRDLGSRMAWFEVPVAHCPFCATPIGHVPM